MAHFAKLGINGKIIGVHAVNDKDCQNADGVEMNQLDNNFYNEYMDGMLRCGKGLPIILQKVCML